jgi:hypothetical protein
MNVKNTDEPRSDRVGHDDIAKELAELGEPAPDPGELEAVRGAGNDVDPGRGAGDELDPVRGRDRDLDPELAYLLQWSHGVVDRVDPAPGSDLDEARVWSKIEARLSSRATAAEAPTPAIELSRKRSRSRGLPVVIAVGLVMAAGLVVVWGRVDLRRSGASDGELAAMRELAVTGLDALGGKTSAERAQSIASEYAARWALAQQGEEGRR